MSEDQSPIKADKRIGLGCVLLLAAGVLVLLVVVAFFAWSFRGSRLVKAELARIRQAGEPVTPGDLEAMYDRSPADPDVGALWLIALGPLEGEAFQAAAGNLPIVGEGEGEIPPPGQPWPDLDAAEALLKQYEEPLGQLHEAAERGVPARYPTDFRAGLMMDMDYVMRMRSGARILTLQAHVCAHRGDAHGAARAIRSLLKLADSIEHEPILISQLVRIACEGIATEAIRELLPHVEFSKEDLQPLQDDLRAHDFKEAVHISLMGERVLGMDLFESMGGRGLGPMFNDDLACYLRYMDSNIAAMKKPWPQARQAARSAQRDLEATAKRGIVAVLRYRLTKMVAPALQAVVEAATRAQATSGMADAAIAVELYRRQHGKLPRKLGELVPEFLPKVPIDPYDGKPLRYVVRQKEYVLYSVGEDGADGGGHGDDTGKPDHVFAVKRIEPKETP